MKVYDLSNSILEFRTSIEIKQKLELTYTKYSKFKDFADSISYWFFKNEQLIFYSLDNSNINFIKKSILDIIKQLRTFNTKNTKLVINKLIAELQEIEFHISHKNTTQLQEHLKLLPKTISKIKYQYFVNLDPEHKNELKILKLLSNKLQSYEHNFIVTNNYEQYLQYGDVLLFFNMEGKKGVVSKLITSFTKSLITHVGIYVDNGKIFESSSSKGGVVEDTIQTKNKQVIVVLRGDLRTHHIENLKQIVYELKQTSPKYGYKELFGHALFQKTGYFPKILRSNTSYFCSELISEIFRKINYPISAGVLSQNITPGSIMDSRNLKLVCVLDNVEENSYQCDIEFLKDIRATIDKFSLLVQ
ncbi:MAG: hypothetical protein LAT82_03875 [Nanoarchaeota archaeon]|nr:hypothetical protein [Nanoarchaeota archaeon]